MRAPSTRRAARLLVWCACLAAGVWGLAGAAAPTEELSRPAETAPEATEEAAEAARPAREAPAPAETPAGEGAAEAADAETPVPAAEIRIDGMIDEGLVATVKRRIADARADGCKIFVFHITSGGGTVGDSETLSDAMDRLGKDGFTTIAFVDARAYSGATMAAMSCRDIVMTPQAQIGAVAVIFSGPSGLQELGETERRKFESPVVTRMERLARDYGRSPAIAKAMVLYETVVVEMRHKETGEVRYVEQNDEALSPMAWERVKVIDADDELISLSAEEAKAYGYAQAVVRDLSALYALYPIEGRLRLYALSMTEGLVALLNNMYLKSLLALIGMLGIYAEFTTPGFGVPGAVGLIAFGLLFVASFLAGRPNWLPVLLFGLGVAGLAIELFVTPAFGLPGGAGALCILASIVLALSNVRGLPETEFDWSQTYRALAMTSVVLLVFLVSAFVLARFLPHVPVLGRIVLATSMGSDGSSTAAAARMERAARLGERGRTVTLLRPAGKARFGDRLVDVVTGGDLVDPGTDVEVVEVRGNRIVVAPVDDAGDGAANA